STWRAARTSTLSQLDLAVKVAKGGNVSRWSLVVGRLATNDSRPRAFRNLTLAAGLPLAATRGFLCGLARRFARRFAGGFLRRLLLCPARALLLCLLCPSARALARGRSRRCPLARTRRGCPARARAARRAARRFAVHLVLGVHATQAEIGRIGHRSAAGQLI